MNRLKWPWERLANNDLADITENEEAQNFSNKQLYNKFKYALMVMQLQTKEY